MKGIALTQWACPKKKKRKKLSHSGRAERNSLNTVNVFAQLYRRESTLPLTPKKVGDMK